MKHCGSDSAGLGENKPLGTNTVLLFLQLSGIQSLGFYSRNHSQFVGKPPDATFCWDVVASQSEIQDHTAS